MLNPAHRESVAPGELQFGAFRLPGPHGPLFADGAVVDLPRKPLSLLWMLASRAGEVITKDELLAEIWPRVVVSEGAISASLRDLRRALGDDAREPRFIATAHRIGYRFIAAVTRGAVAHDPAGPCPRDAVGVAPIATPPAPDALVGRARERAQLMEAYARAADGQRQVVFVTGEAGIGKSRLIEAFLGDLDTVTANTPRPSLVGHGQCIEHHGAGEPYLPILEALTRLARQPGGAALPALLRRHAPSWVAELPGLFDDDLRSRPVPGAGHGSVERMLREMADAIDLAAADRPVVLVLEDMHWSDRSTVDWLAMLARRREHAQLLVIASCRPVELIVTEHPLKQVKQDLVTRHAASELALGRLAAIEVHDYIEQRMRHRDTAPNLAAAVFRRSQGHPLFMVHMADDLQRMPGAVAVPDEGSLPCGVSDLIEAQLARLGSELLAVLEAASVAGAEFASASIAAGLQRSVDEVERVLETLALQGCFIEARGLAEWHDGTVSGRYGFRHDLVREGLYRRLGSARRVRLHGAIGTRLADAQREHASEIASELACHFENAHDPFRAALHRREAGHTALHRCAHLEALTHAAKGLALLDDTPQRTPGRAGAELQLRLIEGAALLATRGYAAPEVEATYTRVLALGIALNDGTAIGPALSGLYNVYLTRAAFAQVQQVADQVLALLQHRPDPVLSMLAHNVRGSALLFAGAPAASLEHVGLTLAVYDAETHAPLSITYGEDPAVATHHYAALSCWIVGDAEASGRHLRDGFALARALAHPFGQAQMLWVEAVIALDNGDIDQVERSTRRLNALSADYGFPLWLAGGQIMRGAALAGRGQHEEGQRLTEAGLGAWQAAGTMLTLPHAFAVAARVQVLGGRLDAAEQSLVEALAVAARTGERWYEPELHRLQGELLLQRRGPDALARAEACFERAITLAHTQCATRFELRASVSAAALAWPEARAAHAHSRLKAVVERLGGACHGPDMQRARAQLSRQITAEITPRS